MAYEFDEPLPPGPIIVRVPFARDEESRAGMRLALKLAPCHLVVVREAFTELVGVRVTREGWPPGGPRRCGSPRRCTREQRARPASIPVPALRPLAGWAGTGAPSPLLPRRSGRRRGQAAAA